MKTKNRRLELDSKLRVILQETLGKVNIYFDPPEGQKLIYPCIVYCKDTADHIWADNKLYRFMQAYQLTYIDKNPDNDVVDRIINEFQYAKYGRNFTVENIHHDVIILFY